MARLRFAATPAAFVGALGALADIVDSEGAPTGSQGHAFLVPPTSGSFGVYDTREGNQLTDLLDQDQQLITAITPSSDFATLGGLLEFYAPDGHEGDVWIWGGGATDPWYRLSPAADELYSRVSAVETAIAEMATTDLVDWSTTPAAGSSVWPRKNLATGLVEYGPPPEAGSAAWDDITGKPATFPAAWGDLSGRPATFPPSTHNHDDRYFTEQQTLDAITANSGSSLETIPSLVRYETSPGVYPARGTDRTDLRIVWVGTVQPPIAASGGATDWSVEGVAMAGVDKVELYEEP